MLRLVLLAGCAVSMAVAGGYEGSYGGNYGGGYGSAQISSYGGSSYGAQGGESKTTRHQDDYGNYEFKYDIKDGYGNVRGRQEKGGHGGVVGSYYLGEIDGRHRSVEYQADKLGFRANVKTNEPGTKTSEPAFAPYHNNAYGKSIPSGSIQVSHGQSYGGHSSYGGYGQSQGGYGGY